MTRKAKVNFFTNNHFLITGHVKKMSNLAKIEFLAHFWQYGSVTLFWRGQKTRSDFFHKTMTFDFLSSQFWWAETCATLMTQTLFSDFVIRGCRGGILIMVDFDHLGYDLNRHGSFFDGVQNCIQTCLHHTVSC